jgi:hypothetical protein
MIIHDDKKNVDIEIKTNAPENLVEEFVYVFGWPSAKEMLEDQKYHVEIIGEG